MVDKKVAIVVKIEYEIDDNRERVWTAYIMAFSQDEAVEYLAKFLKKTIKVTSVGMEAPRIDAITSEVRETITGKPKKKKANVEPKLDGFKNLQNAREQALKDLKDQNVGTEQKEEKPTEKKKPTISKSLNIKKK